MPSEHTAVASSFRDPSGFVFSRDGVLYRQVNRCYEENFRHLVDSGLHDALVGAGLVIPFVDVGLENAATGEACAILRPEPVPFISYPYEWCFSQLKEAALLTLRIQQRALESGMSLKDASAYNVQFVGSKPVLIDTLSFEKYREGEPWVAYRQFCQHFLAPLALMSRVDIRLQQFLRIHLDGIPLDLASRLLPKRTQANFGLLSHIHLHAKAQARFSGRAVSSTGRRRMSRTAFLVLADSLRSTVEKLTWLPSGTEWHDYYDITNYSAEAFEHKKELVAQMLARISPRPRTAWDLGANTGVFGLIASELGIQTVAFDIDPAAVEKSFLQNRASGGHLLPLLLDLTNPSPAIGWENRERLSLAERGPADLVLALALVHHLAISNNLPLGRIAHFLRHVCRTLIIEFVPKSDSQVQRLLASREDIFGEYEEPAFEREFGKHFSIEMREPVAGSQRTLYLMKAL